MEQAVKINLAPTYNDSRAKIVLWNDPQVILQVMLKSIRDI